MDLVHANDVSGTVIFLDMQVCTMRTEQSAKCTAMTTVDRAVEGPVNT